MSYNELLELVKQQQDHIAVLEQENKELVIKLEKLNSGIFELYSKYQNELK